MAQESIRKHLRAALDEVLSAEKARLHKLYDESDADIAGRIKMMRPLIEALNSLKHEVGTVEGLDISSSPHGHIATVKLKSSASQQSISISTNIGNSQFQVEENLYYTFSSDSFEKRHTFSSTEEVLTIVVDAVGKHIASNQVLSERKK